VPSFADLTGPAREATRNVRRVQVPEVQRDADDLPRRACNERRETAYLARRTGYHDVDHLDQHDDLDQHG